MRYHTPIACSFAALLLLAQFGCLGPSNSARLMSSQSQTELATDLTTRVYSGIDRFREWSAEKLKRLFAPRSSVGEPKP